MLPSLDEVLALEVCRRGRPAVVAGHDRLDTPVRWVHAIELTDVARLLRGGELVLSTGIALPDDDRLLTAYVTELAHVGVAGRPVILAALSHRVLAFSPGGADPGRLLSGFAARSRSVVLRGRTAYDEASGWLVTPVGAQGE